MTGTYDQMQASDCAEADACVMDPDCPFVRNCRTAEDQED